MHTKKKVFDKVLNKRNIKKIETDDLFRVLEIADEPNQKRTWEELEIRVFKDKNVFTPKKLVEIMNKVQSYEDIAYNEFINRFCDNTEDMVYAIENTSSRTQQKFINHFFNKDLEENVLSVIVENAQEDDDLNKAADMVLEKIKFKIENYSALYHRTEFTMPYDKIVSKFSYAKYLNSIIKNCDNTRRSKAIAIALKLNYQENHNYDVENLTTIINYGEKEEQITAWKKLKKTNNEDMSFVVCKCTNLEYKSHALNALIENKAESKYYFEILKNAKNLNFSIFMEEVCWDKFFEGKPDNELLYNTLEINDGKYSENSIQALKSLLENKNTSIEILKKISLKKIGEYSSKAIEKILLNTKSNDDLNFVIKHGNEDQATRSKFRKRDTIDTFFDLFKEYLSEK